MKVSRTTLQTYIDAPLPSVEAIADAFTFHCFEIDAVEGETLDIKVLPNRAADCNTPEGVAAELASILDLPRAGAPALDYTEAVEVAVTQERINAILGSDFSLEEIEAAFRRLRFFVEKAGEVFRVRAPAPRTDIRLQEDVAEEVGRLLGYERIPSVQLPPPLAEPTCARYRGIERMKDELVAEGFTEVSTQSFAATGDITLANPLDVSRPYLRTTLEENLQDALVRAKRFAPRVLSPGVQPKLFEVGSVFPKAGEYLELRMTEGVSAWGDAAPTVDNLSRAKLEEYGKNYEPKTYRLGSFAPLSPYPFMTRDIAFWASPEREPDELFSLIHSAAGALLVKLDLFDQFKKEERVSYGFRLVFESMERTLTDEEIGAVMEKVTAALANAGCVVR